MESDKSVGPDDLAYVRELGRTGGALARMDARVALLQLLAYGVTRRG